MLRFAADAGGGVGSRFRGNDAAPGIGGDGARRVQWGRRGAELTALRYNAHDPEAEARSAPRRPSAYSIRGRGVIN